MSVRHSNSHVLRFIMAAVSILSPRPPPPLLKQPSVQPGSTVLAGSAQPTMYGESARPMYAGSAQPMWAPSVPVIYQG